LKPKAILTVVLLVFVAASVAYLVIKESRSAPVQSPASSGVPAKSKVIAYYFYGNVRCTTCRTIEAYTEEAIETGFAEALKDGRLEWRAINTDDIENEHFTKDFQLTTRSVIIERFANGKSVEWKNLLSIWELVRGEKADYLKYIQDETRSYLEAAAK